MMALFLASYVLIMTAVLTLCQNDQSNQTCQNFAEGPVFQPGDKDILEHKWLQCENGLMTLKGCVSDGDLFYPGNVFNETSSGIQYTCFAEFNNQDKSISLLVKTPMKCISNSGYKMFDEIYTEEGVRKNCTRQGIENAN